MAIALVSAGTPALTTGPAFGQATAAGNLLIGWLYTNNSSATFNDTLAGTGWVNAASGGGSFNWASVWYKPNSSAGESAPTVTTGGSVYYARVAEYSGAATSTPVDSSGGNNGSGGSTETATNTASDAAAGSLIISCSGWNGGNTGGTITVTMADSAGASVTPTVSSATNGTGFYCGFAYGVAGSTGGSKDTATGTLTVFCNGAGSIASFKATSGPAPGSAPFRPAAKAIRAALPQHQGQSLQIWQPGLIYVDSA